MSSDYLHRSLLRVVEPATEPLTLAETKLYLRVDGTSEDTLITDLIVAVRIAAEEYLRLSLIEQTWKLTFEDYIDSSILLPRGPVVSISGVTLIDREGGATIVNSDLYELSADRRYLALESDFYAHRIEIEYICGYDDASSVPAPIRQGMLAHMATLFDGRETGASLPPATIQFYQPFREILL